MTSGYKNWPKDLPLFVVHGEADKVTDADASKEFVQKLKAGGVKDVEYKGFEGFYVSHLRVASVGRKRRAGLTGPVMISFSLPAQHEMHNEVSPPNTRSRLTATRTGLLTRRSS